MPESILISIKKLLGIEAGYNQFDTDIIMHINSGFSQLYQIGINPTGDVFEISAPGEGVTEETWEDYVGGNKQINMVKSYLYQFVRLQFDPPATSFGITAMQEQVATYEWRLREMQSLFVYEDSTSP